MDKKLPSFLIVGAGKSGSTSLYYYLSQHPKVFMPANKEPNFLVSDYQQRTSPACPSYKDDRKRMVFDFKEYIQLFEKSAPGQILGEATVTYLYQYKEAIPKIKHYLGEDTKIIIILRNPIDRSYSNYAYACELGYESLSYRDALDEENNRLANNWSSIYAYQAQSNYYEQVKAYIEAFNNVHIIITDELKNSPQEVMTKIFNFLKLPKIDINVNEVFNPTGIPRYRLLHNFLNQSGLLKSFFKILLSPFFSEDKLRDYTRKMRSKNIIGRMKNNDLETEMLLHNELDKNTIKLEKLINKDLKSWYMNEN